MRWIDNYKWNVQKGKFLCHTEWGKENGWLWLSILDFSLIYRQVFCRLGQVWCSRKTAVFSWGWYLQCIQARFHQHSWEWSWLMSLAPAGCDVASSLPSPEFPAGTLANGGGHLKACLGNTKAVVTLTMWPALRTLPVSPFPIDTYGGNINSRDNPTNLLRSWRYRVLNEWCSFLSHHVTLSLWCPNPGLDTRVSLSMTSRKQNSLYSCMNWVGCFIKCSYYRICNILFPFSIFPLIYFLVYHINSS